MRCPRAARPAAAPRAVARLQFPPRPSASSSRDRALSQRAGGERGSLPTASPSSLPPPARRVAASAVRDRPPTSSSKGGRRLKAGHNDAPDPSPPPDATAMLSGGTLAAVAGLVLLGGTAVAAREPLRAFVDYFIGVVDDLGPAGYLAYGAVYTALEVLAVPAIPLTMTAGAIFGVAAGTALVSASATLAATAAFVIARYAARDRVQAYAERSPRFAAVDRAIGRDGFKVVTLLRMSPLLPLAASSYLYGLTSVDLPSYVAGSWLGMLPGTVAYVAAGHYGRAMLVGGGGGGGGADGGGLSVEPWQLALGGALSVASLAYVGRLAAQAIQEESEREE